MLVAVLGVACAGRPPVAQEAALLSEKGNDRGAIELLDAHLKSTPDDVASRRLLVRILAVAGETGRVQAEVAALAARLPEGSPIPWLELGHALELSHQYEDALRQYDRAAEVAKGDPAGPRTGGLRAARWGDAAAAQPRLEEALRRDPRDAEVWHALGVVRLELGDLEGAETAYSSGLVADPGALANRLGLATLALRRRDPAVALVHYRHLVRERPGFLGAYLGCSLALIELGRWDEAEQALAVGRERGVDARALARQTHLLRERRFRGGARRGDTPPTERDGTPGNR